MTSSEGKKTPMGRGQFFQHEFHVLPALDGGFIVTLGSQYQGFKARESYEGWMQDRWAFSSVSDLLKFLAAQVIDENSPSLLSSSDTEVGDK